MNKWSVDRFITTGPLLPQNFQLVDISSGGTTMPVLYDCPLGVGEPHYCQMIKADKLKAWEAYPAIGWDPQAQAVSPLAPQTGKEGGQGRQQRHRQYDRRAEPLQSRARGGQPG